MTDSLKLCESVYVFRILVPVCDRLFLVSVCSRIRARGRSLNQLILQRHLIITKLLRNPWVSHLVV